MPAMNLLAICYTLALLLCFGIGWNYLVARLEAAKVEGHTWELVAGGVAITVGLAGPLIGWLNVLILLGCFVASGAPMILGAMRRHHFKWRRFLRLIQGFDDGREQAPTTREQSPSDHQ